jgi:hypothetical protein
MSLRWSYLALIALVLASEAGCCCCGDCGSGGERWCGSQCGEVFWNEWFSIPPNCCDPCDDCGGFVGPKRDSTYSDGRRTASRQPEPVQGRPVQAEPDQAEPDQAEPLPEQPYTAPGPSDEMPEEPTAGVMHDEFGQAVSYDELVDSPPPSRTLGSPRRSNWRAR